MNRKRYYRLLIWFLGTLLVAFLAARIYLPWTHTLKKNGSWVSTKVGLAKGVMGGVAFEITPLGLVQDRLNLGVWHGFQEVWLRHRLIPKQISFDLELSENAYGYFLFDKSPQGLSGLRLSRNPEYPSMFFRADARGAFQERIPLSHEELGQSRQTFVVDFTSAGVGLRGPQGELGRFSGDYLHARQIGFRGGAHDLWLDNIRVDAASGESFDETFDNPTSLWLPWLAAWSGLVLLNGLIYFWKRNFYSVMTFNFMLFCIALPLDFTNRLFLTRGYEGNKLIFKAVTQWGDYASNIETKSEALDRLRRDDPLEARKQGRRLLFVGTSQTWGAGSTQAADAFVARLERRWQEAGQNPSVQIINAGISGEKAGSLLRVFQEEWMKWRPDAVALNLSNNDQDSEIFRRDMEAWLRFTQEENIPTLLILEANNPEQIRKNLLPNHETLRQLSRSFQVSFLDFHACLAAHEEEGFLWWDFVHLSSFGQEIAQTCLDAPLRNLMRQEK